MFSRQGIDFVRLEEAMNNMLTDPNIEGRRTAQADLVREMLRRRIHDALAHRDFPESLRTAYLAGEEAAEQAMRKLLPDLLSQRKMLLLQRRLRKLPPKKGNPDAQKVREESLRFLMECLLDKEQIRFREEAGLLPKVWLKFYNSTGLSSPQTLQRIKNALKLTEAQRAEFDALTIREVFPAVDALKLEIHARRKATGMDVLDFLNYAYVGKDAWEIFYPIPTENSDPVPPRNTSQDTLLKLIIGFRLPEQEGWDFLALVESGFWQRRDQVFLACIRTGQSDPDTVSEITAFYADAEDGFADPYARILL